MPTVGFLYSGSPQSLRGQYQAFRNALPAGVNVWPPTAGASGVHNNYGNLQVEATALINRPVDVLVAAGGTVCALAAKNAKVALGSNIRIVYTGVTDPVGNGLKTAGGDMTGVAGMTTDLDAARLRLLQDMVPGLTTVGVLRNASRPNLPAQWANLQAVKDPTLTLIPGDVSPPPAAGHIRNVIQTLVAYPVQALLVTADPLFNDQRADVITPGGTPLSIPAIYQWREFADDSGLMSFGPNLVEEYTAAANYVTRILNGEAPAHIPLYQPMKFELVINSGSANALSLKIPPSLFSRAYVI
jgi:putative tryptophan/tyrosine transport system substrate-binding protein